MAMVFTSKVLRHLFPALSADALECCGGLARQHGVLQPLQNVLKNSLKGFWMFVNPLAELSDEAHGSDPDRLVDGGREGENLVQHRGNYVILFRDYIPKKHKELFFQGK